jgi:ribosome-binding protein aMBF1 (putative translation factor)
MVTLQKNLMQKQMDELLKAFATGKQSAQLSVAWIQSCRLALGMSLRQLAERIGVSAPALNDFEKRELADTISIATLKKAAAAIGYAHACCNTSRRYTPLTSMRAAPS